MFPFGCLNDYQVGLRRGTIPFGTRPVPASGFGPALHQHDGIGWVIADKFCARKRPNLLPVYDAVVKGALQPTRSSYWLLLRATLREHELVPVLEDLRNRAELGRTTLLRVFDVAVWMEARRSPGLSTVATCRDTVAS